MSVKSKAMDSEDSDVAERDPSGRYVRFNEILGSGACKTVYKAFDEVDGIEVAWNQVCIDEVVQSPEHLERLHSEVHLLKSLKHDSIIKCYCSWVDDDNRTVNMITELFTSGSLRQYRNKHRNVDLKAIKNWARQILRGLLHLHTHNPPIIHRDLKCDNIFINGNAGKVKIGDLGLAVVMDQAAVHSVLGTPEFMAPELYEEEYNELVDIYSFGMCMLEMVTCEYPYSECKNPAQIYKKVTSGIKPASLGKVSSPRLKQFIEKCLLPASSRPSAAELLKDPFFAPDNSVTAPCITLRPSDNMAEVQSHSMDIDSDGGKSSTISSECGNQLPLTVIELSKSNNVNTFHLSGKVEGDDSIYMTLTIAGKSGPPEIIDFIFYLLKDTTLSIAGEMVDDLNLPGEDVLLIAELIDEMIRQIELRRACQPSMGELVATYGPSERKEDHTAQQSFLSEISTEFTCSYGVVELGEGSNSGISDIVSMSSMSSQTLDDDDNGCCKELKMELAAIDSQYQQMIAELLKLRDEAIENAKRKLQARKTHAT